MSGFTTPEQDRRFHAVADQFDRPTRRKVQRAVAKGEPPLDEQLRPLALLYLDRLERSAAHTSSASILKMKVRTLYSVSTCFYAVAATFTWITGGPILATLFTIAAVINLYVALSAPKLQAKRKAQLQRSRELLVGNIDVA